MTMLAVGIDPSLVATGLAAVDIEAGLVLDWVCIRTKPDGKLKATEDLARRLQEVAFGVRAFITKHKGVLVIEGQVGGTFEKGTGRSSPSTVFLLGAAYGAVLGCMTSKPIAIHSATIKARILGDRVKRADTKAAAWEAAQAYFTSFPKELTNKPAREAVHDAVITAVAALPEIMQIKAMMSS